MLLFCGYKQYSFVATKEQQTEMSDNSVIRLRVDPEFKGDVEAMARSRKISVSALVRQSLVDAVAAHKRAATAVIPATDGDQEEGRAA